MNTVLHLDDSLLFNEGATRKCYLHPSNQGKCLKIEKKSDGTNRHDLEAYHAAKTMMNHFTTTYDNELADTNFGKALVCELVFDDNGQPSQSFASYKTKRHINQKLTAQFMDFFNLLRENDLFFYDFNPKNFLIQKTASGEQLKYTDLKSLGKTKTAFSLEKIPYFARMKLNRRIRRFVNRYLSPPKTEIN